MIDDPAGWRIERGADALALAGPLVGAAVEFLLPVVALLMAAGVVASIAQGVPRVVPDRIMPDFARISPRAGFRRMFGARGAVEFAKSLIKLGAVTAVAGIVLLGQKAVLLTAMEDDPGALPERIQALTIKTIGAVLAATLAVASADLVWSRILWRRDNRMSRQEVKEELQAGRGRPSGQGPPAIAAPRPLAPPHAVGGAACDHGGRQSNPLCGGDAICPQ